MTSNFRNIYRRVHSYAGNGYRLITAIRYQRKIKTSEASTIFGASFGASGWHHIRKTLEEYDRNPDVDYRDTTMYLYLKHFTPSTIGDLIEVDGKESCELPFFVYPWGTFKKNQSEINKDPQMSRFCGPSSDEFIKDEFDRTLILYKKLQKTGYRPWDYGNTFIGGTFLINQQGERRFVVLQGNHRMAMLAHLGYESLFVRDVPGNLDKITERNKQNWLLVKSGQCPLTIADRIFTMFFHEDGHHINQRLQSIKP
jgi:hypothetical protein